MIPSSRALAYCRDGWRKLGNAPARNRRNRPVSFPVLPVFRPCYSPVPRARLFLRHFNGFSCIRRVSTPCKSPVFFSTGFFKTYPRRLGPRGTDVLRRTVRTIVHSAIATVIVRVGEARGRGCGLLKGSSIENIRFSGFVLFRRLQERPTADGAELKSLDFPGSFCAVPSGHAHSCLLARLAPSTSAPSLSQATSGSILP
jgi:hypothetical protein